MSDPLEVARIEITRALTDPDGDLIGVTFADALTLIEALGMLRMAELTIIAERMGETCPPR